VRQHQATLRVRTQGRGFVDLTEPVRDAVAKSGVRTGLVVVHCPHTSCSLLVQENADPAVRRDLLRFLDEVAPEGRAYEHDAEGEDDMPSHLKASITRTSESIPVVEGRVALGRWQALYLAEHRTAPHERSVLVHVLGE
jgi:secondary thiamine-phosphate synthase enzyme